ncbi:hypothetical protein LCGC14_2536210 [marine sediment metagenome]|uniref:Uncharacterized protein n=1 Tax=marine sediment metagenome TaxID=412755 RepID=A0A0F9BF07_9ZZZZ
MVSIVLDVWQKLFLPRPDPSRPLTVRHSAYRYGPDRVGTFSNSQFSVSIFNLTKKLAHFVMGRATR